MEAARPSVLEAAKQPAGAATAAGPRALARSSGNGRDGYAQQLSLERIGKNAARRSFLELYHALAAGAERAEECAAALDAHLALGAAGERYSGDGCTLLHVACTYGASYEVVHKILEADRSQAAVQTQVTRYTPLHYCGANGMPKESVRAITRAWPAACRALDLKGQTPEQLGVKMGQNEVVVSIRTCRSLWPELFTEQYEAVILASHKESAAASAGSVR